MGDSDTAHRHSGDSKVSALLGLTCSVYRQHLVPEAEISDSTLRRAFAASVVGTNRQWRAFIKLLRVIGVAE